MLHLCQNTSLPTGQQLLHVLTSQLMLHDQRCLLAVGSIGKPSCLPLPLQIKSHTSWA